MIAVALITAADRRGIVFAGRVNGSAIDGDMIAGAVSSAADARGIITTGRVYGSSVNDDIIAGAVLTAADARAAVTAGRGNISAVDRDMIAGSSVNAADAGKRIIDLINVQLAGFCISLLSLLIDRQAVILSRYRDALVGGQSRIISEDQIYVAGAGKAAVDLCISRHRVPARRQRDRPARDRGNAASCLRGAVRVEITDAVQRPSRQDGDDREHAENHNQR